ncbi:MAG: acyl carrier protein [Verrucomicrobiota bacterium]
MSTLTPDRVRTFLLQKYAPAMNAMGLNAQAAPDDFDFLVSGVIDSFGILEMVSAIEDEFKIQLDMETLDAEQITVLGPLSRYVAQNAVVNGQN